MNSAPVLDAAYLHEEQQLLVHTLIGVYEWERAAVRPLVFALRLYSVQPLGLSRAHIEHRLQAWLAPCRYRLLEALAEHLTQQMFVAWQCQTIVLEIEKPGALGELAKVGVCFTRTRQTD